MVRRATVTRVDDGASFIIRPNMVVKLDGVEAERAKERLEQLILGKKVEFDTREWDRLGRSTALVQIDGVDVNEEMKRFLEFP